MKIPRISIVILLCLFAISCQFNKKKTLQVSNLFSDHMVLQQQQNVAFWGTYTSSEKITVTTSWGEKGSTKGDENGNWRLEIKTPPAGGPFSIIVSTSDDSITIKDVLIGEVWLASGQSNMSMPLEGWLPEGPIKNSEKEIAMANYPNIRMLKVAHNLAVTPIDSISGKWVPATPKTVNDYSATAYFFARKLHQELNVPIGIINSSWGGTPAEAWTSEKAIRVLEDFNSEVDSIKSLTSEQNITSWFQKWPTKKLPETAAHWKAIDFSDLDAAANNFDDTLWENITLPGGYDEVFSGKIDGAIWLRKKITITDVSTDYTLTIGAVDDMDATFFNGKRVGGLTGSNVWDTKREISIPKNLLKEGENTIAIRAIDTNGNALIKAPLTLTNTSGVSISLEGEWKSRLCAEIYNGRFYVYGLHSTITERPSISQLNPNLPTLLYNAMINPLKQYNIKGAIWYQGESNVGRHEQYQELFPALIKNWRSEWGYEFPFYFVQIAPYTYKNTNGDRSQKLREAQRLSLKTPKTGMVVTLDIGDSTNIHPANKQDVGLRLSNLALANDYEKVVVTSGPLFKNMRKINETLIVNFNHLGTGLVASEKGLVGFEIAGADKNYLPALADIVGNSVEVSHPEIESPEYVRYAWKDNPEVGLFNKEGLPASSFTSENK